MALQTHKDLKVWKGSMRLVRDIYLLTTDFPPEEKFSLTSQIRRSVVSIPSNIAEGAARESNKEFIRYLYIALGSLSELDTQCEIAKNLLFIKVEDFQKLAIKLDEIGKMLSGLISYRKSKD